MTNKITLNEVERLVAQLPVQEQLELMARISERLSVVMSRQSEDERWHREYTSRVEAFLRMSEEMAAETIGEVDSAEDIRQIREERTSKL
ncbi:MAG TPA: hypothetical protein VHT73_04435 [Thermodesulfobacteriota bacterium]|nr:hypothetical protein [Thermodesulfobacteriota bacterium]